MRGETEMTRYLVTATGSQSVTLSAVIEADDEEMARERAELLPEQSWEIDDHSFISDIAITDVDIED